MAAGEVSEAEMSEECLEKDHDEDHGLVLPRVQRPRYKKLAARPLKSCHMTVDLCLHLIHKAMCKNQWERAAGLMTSYLQTLENRHTERQRAAPEIIWRLGKEILLNHPKAENEDINVFNEYMKNIGLKNYLSMSLEQAFHMLCNGETDDALRVLGLAESWRYGRLSIRQNKLQKLIQAHRAVLNYRSWLDRKAAASQNDLDYASQSSSSQVMGSYYRQATVTFREIVQQPGVWDPFILNYVHLLESSGEIQEATKILTEYANNTKNPPNPNAHVYLYEFMERNEASDETLIKVLRPLHAMTPSHKLMLTYSKLLHSSDSEDDQKLALLVLFDLLDFSGWKKNVEAWSYLAKQLKKTFRHDHSAWILEAWEPRKSWWPSYHFAKLHAKKDWHECAKLAMKKALVAGMLQGPACVYFTSVCASGEPENKTTALNRIKKYVMKHNCVNVPNPGLPLPESDVEEAAT
ncbi:TATA box-binding protein-associated factor RNA polymerase I subunit A [Dendropsophus ebraccatus]|uniref:TATA box-binding protein-associated factor RNA polymerase I subunit A n=1 Tax=Dendropsophus ebraccatus TaxID=150705 RepID=UPI003831FBCD